MTPKLHCLERVFTFRSFFLNRPTCKPITKFLRAQYEVFFYEYNVGISRNNKSLFLVIVALFPSIPASNVMSERVLLSWILIGQMSERHYQGNVANLGKFHSISFKTFREKVRRNHSLLQKNHKMNRNQAFSFNEMNCCKSNCVFCQTQTKLTT